MSLKDLIEVCCSVILLCTSIFVGVFGIIYLFDHVPTKCWVDGQLVFDGRSACIDIVSSGAATKVIIRRGLFCVVPDEYYVSKDVKLEGVKSK